jgi:4-azaleucine resistance transporter AzlC
VKTKTELKLALKLSIPTLFAYFPLGIVFSILWLKAGFPGFWAPIMSIFAFAGAVQFVALSMMQDHAGLFAILLAISFIAFRNVFYGLSFIERFKNMPKSIKAFLIFGLVDATYGMLTANPENEEHNDTAFCFYVALFPFIYWVSGTGLGLLLYSYMPPLHGFEFMLTSFFMILVIDYYLISRDRYSLFMPIIFALISYMLLPNQFLLVSIIFSTLFIHFKEYYKDKKEQCVS